MHEGWTKSIPKEWDEDVKKPPVPTTVIMDGGGNDVISVRGLAACVLHVFTQSCADLTLFSVASRHRHPCM